MAELIEHLARRGGFRSTVHSATDGPLRPALEASGADIRIAPMPPLDDPVAYERSVLELGGWLDGRFDVVFGATVTNFPAIDAAVRAGLPSVLRIGEAVSLRTVVAWLFTSLAPAVELAAHRAVAGASAVLSNSAAAVRTYLGEGYSGRFVVLRTGVDVVAGRAALDTLDRQRCRDQLGIGGGERLLVCAGSIWPVKGQALLVSALDLVHRQSPELTCALIGQTMEEHAAAIAAFATHRGLGDRVRMVPFCDDLRPWWRSADIAVCPSESEATPAVVLEAMAHGLPVLGSRVGDVADLVEPGVTGWLFDPSDLGALTGALAVVAATPPEALRAMGRAAADAVRAHDRAVVLNQSANLLRDVAGGGLRPWQRARRGAARGSWGRWRRVLR
jgi:glycosyltransferase involved in cell wall biosynthesis